MITLLIQISRNEWFNSDWVHVKNIQVKTARDSDKAYVVIVTYEGEFWSDLLENVYIARAFANSFAVKFNSLKKGG